MEISPNGKKYMLQRISVLQNQIQYITPQLGVDDARNRTSSFCMAAGLSCKLKELVDAYYVLFGEKIDVSRTTKQLRFEQDVCGESNSSGD